MESRVDRTQIADLILARMRQVENVLGQQYRAHKVPHFVLDDLLPLDLAQRISRAFPDKSQMMLRDSLRERKYVTSQMNHCDPLVEETIFAFHDPRIVDLVANITGLRQVESDPHLYAGGISVMGRGHYLNPHIDNSHDKARERYRLLNLLYYTSPEWSPDFGGSLELWPEGPAASQPLVIPSVFNRLVVMATNKGSWHSVNEVRVDRSRCCVSNYYFSTLSPEKEEYFHPTSFRGRPEQPIRDLFLRADASLRSAIRRIARRGLVETRHYYRREG
jgi:Rps23 Pro-64 3,4-dihydroxylase Tpa1-like proline 4-hydroxylase